MCMCVCVCVCVGVCVVCECAARLDVTIFLVKMRRTGEVMVTLSAEGRPVTGRPTTSASRLRVKPAIEVIESVEDQITNNVERGNEAQLRCTGCFAVRSCNR